MDNCEILDLTRGEPFSRLPDELVACILGKFLRPWAEGFWFVNRRFLRILKEYVPYYHIPPPTLPCSVHLELDVRSSSRLVGRWIYTITQHLWDLPMNVQRFEWVPGKFCRAKEEWQVDESWPVWKLILKNLLSSSGNRLSDDFPNYCELRMFRTGVVDNGSVELFAKGYLSHAVSSEFISLSRRSSSKQTLEEEDVEMTSDASITP